MEFLSGLVDAGAIITIDHEDQALGTGKIMPPQGPDLILSTDIPHVELDVFIGDGFDVEADGGDRGDVLI